VNVCYRLRRIAMENSMNFEGLPYAARSDDPPSAHAAVPALVAALKDDPFYVAIRSDVAGDWQAESAMLARYFSMSLSEAGRIGMCSSLDDPVCGAAAWLVPRTPSQAAADAVAKAQALETILGPHGLASYHRIVEFMAPLAAAVIPAEAWYLSIVGIDPQLQGQGLGEALLRPTLDEMDATGTVGYLETFTPRNSAFYRRLGFVEVRRHFEPCTAAWYALMRRDPRKR
jgi:GNAT superfamily N-acetyltransferase